MCFPCNLVRDMANQQNVTKKVCSRKDECCAGMGNTNLTVTYNAGNCKKTFTDIPCEDVTELCECRAGKVVNFKL